MYLLIPVEDGYGVYSPLKLAMECRLINNLVEVENEIIQQSKKQFFQVQGTLFRLESLTSIELADDNFYCEIL